MTAEERVHALMEFRFTERQARFLALVMRHADVCVPRQYARFAGIPTAVRSATPSSQSSSGVGPQSRPIACTTERGCTGCTPGGSIRPSANRTAGTAARCRRVAHWSG